MGDSSLYFINFISNKEEFDTEEFKKWMKDDVESKDDERQGSWYYNYYNFSGLEYMQVKILDKAIDNSNKLQVIKKLNDNIKYDVKGINYVLTTSVDKGGEETLIYLINSLQEYSKSIVYINGAYVDENIWTYDGEMIVDDNQEKYSKNIIVNNIPVN